jgi:NTE family protein
MGIEMTLLDTHGRKVGLALSGGAARGLAHVGVLAVLQQEGIPINMIAGTSAGAVMGAIYAWNRDTEQMIEQALDTNWKKFGTMVDPSFPWTGLIKGRKVKRLISSFIPDKVKFSDLHIPFACVATDIDTGEEIVINKGVVLDALRASVSIPGIFNVVKREGRYLVDGGLTTPVPVNVVRKMGADFVIAVNVNPDVSGRMGKSSRQRVEAKKEPNIFQVMMQSFYITTHSLAQNNMANADFVIEPELSNIGASEFQRADEMLELGAQATREAMPEIKRKLAEPD